MLCRSLLSNAILLASVLFATEEQEKIAEAQEGIALYQPIRSESWIVDNLRLDQTGIIIGAGQDQWTALLAGGTITGNQIKANTDNPSLLVTNKQYTLYPYGDWQLMTGMSFSSILQSGAPTSIYGPNQDPFYGMGFFGGLNLLDGWVLGFALTNNKIYAVYSRTDIAQDSINNYYAFSFYVPISNRVAGDVDTLALVINKKENKVSYRANGFEYLLITRPGLPIAEKFLVGSYGGSQQVVGLPSSLQVSIALTIPSEPGIPHTACQQTVFQACTENIDCAYRTLCQYAPLQDMSSFSYNMTGVWSFISVIEQNPVLSCYCGRKGPGCEVCEVTQSYSSSSCSSSSSSSECCKPPRPCPSSSSSSSSCGCSSSSSSSSSCGCESSSSSVHNCQPNCDPLPAPICIPASSTSSYECSSESSSECGLNRSELRALGFIFPF